MNLQKNFSRADRFCPTRRNCLHFDERVDTNLKVKTSSRMLKSNHPLLVASKNTNEKIDHLSKFLSFLGFEKINDGQPSDEITEKFF